MTTWNKAAVLALLNTETQFSWIDTRELATIALLALA